jgi:hypothetical protein
LDLRRCCWLLLLLLLLLIGRSDWSMVVLVAEAVHGEVRWSQFDVRFLGSLQL